MYSCPSANNTIVAGYVAAVEPYHSACIRKDNWLRWCKRPGFVIELWVEFAKAIRCNLQLVQFFDYGAFAPNENNTWGGMMESLSAGTIDATASHLAFSNARVLAFQAASVFGYSSNQFVAKTSMAKERELNLAVFSWPIFVLLFASIMLCGILYYSGKFKRCRRLECFWYSSDELMHFVDRRKTLLSYFLALGCLSLQLAYFAEFRSRAVREKMTETAKFDQLTQDFRTGRRKLLIVNVAHVKDADKLLLFGKTNMDNDGRLILTDGYETSIKMLCANDEYILLGNIIELRAIAKEHQICHYGPIEITSASEADFLLYHMSNFVPHGILFATHVNKSVVEKMNEIILKFFKDEDFENHWHPRYRTKMDIGTNFVESMSDSPSSIRLYELKDGFKFWFAGIGIATGFFLVATWYDRKRGAKVPQLTHRSLQATTFLPKIALSAFHFDHSQNFKDTFNRKKSDIQSFYA